MKAIIDIVLIVIIALCTWNGYKRGLVGGIAGILAIIISLFGSSLLASAYSHEVVPAVEPGFEQGDAFTDLWSGETVPASRPVTLPPHGAAACRIG